ncbi:MAG TPA: protealysin inhibitor emfourin [Pyrinomonadaceae bacterium]
MRISFDRAGGFAAPAMRRSFKVDTDELAADEAEELRGLLAEADIPSAASRQNAERAGAARPRPDAFHYRLVVEDDEDTRTVVASDADMPESLRPLVQWLTKRSTPGDS